MMSVLQANHALQSLQLPTTLNVGKFLPPKDPIYAILDMESPQKYEETQPFPHNHFQQVLFWLLVVSRNFFMRFGSCLFRPFSTEGWSKG